GSSCSRYSRPRSTFSGPTKRAITSGPGSLIRRPALGHVGRRIERHADAGRGELAYDLTVGQHVSLSPHQTAAGTYDLRLRAQPVDLLGVHRADEAGEDVDRGDRALPNLLVGEDRRRRRGHRGIRERRGHATLDHPERVAELFARGHLVHRLAATELHEVHVDGFRDRRAQLARPALLHHLIDEVVTHSHALSFDSAGPATANATTVSPSWSKVGAAATQRGESHVTGCPARA